MPSEINAWLLRILNQSYGVFGRGRRGQPYSGGALQGARILQCSYVPSTYSGVPISYSIRMYFLTHFITLASAFGSPAVSSTWEAKIPCDDQYNYPDKLNV